MKEFKLKNQNITLSCYEWSVKKPKKQLIVIHGLAEHAKRYDHFAGFLNLNNINVFSMDLRGHGESIDEGLGVFSAKGGWQSVIEDINILYEYVKNLNPEMDIVLMGHSMGSIFARSILQKNEKKFKKCVLSGVTINKPVLRDVAPFIASLYANDKPAPVLDKLSFGSFNNAFKPSRTSFDWLSRDESHVDKYISDEKCGFVASGSMFKDVASVLLFTLKKSNINNMPKETPIFIVSGKNDPCGSFGYDAKYLNASYKKIGIDVKYKLYEDARHELINETNYEEVYNDIYNFIIA